MRSSAHAVALASLLMLSSGCARGLPRVSEWPSELLTPSRPAATTAAATPAQGSPAEGPHSEPTATKPSWLSDEQWQRVRGGDLVALPMTFSIRSGSYIGGVGLQRINVPPDNLADYLTHVPYMRDWMPFTRRVEQVEGGGCDVVIELEQGVKVYSKTYSIRAFRVGRMVQWRLDPSRPHDIDDIWGYFRLVPFEGGSLLIMGMATDLRIGPIGLAVEKQVTERMLELPDDIRRAVSGRAAELKRRAAAGQLQCIDR